MRIVVATAVTLAVSWGAAVGLASSDAAAANHAAVGCKREAGKQVVPTPNFWFTLLLGRVENMYMPRQVRANHLKHGEVMLRGAMSTGQMLTGGPLRHLEVQICKRPTRAVVATATPTIVVVDLTSGKRRRLPISVMEGIGQGLADLHYGNNIALPVGHRFAVIVTWNETARFHFATPQKRR